MQKLTITILSILLGASLAQARGGGGGNSWMIGASVAPSSATSDMTNPAAVHSSSSSTDLGLKVGYTFGSLFIGGLYNSYTTSGNSSYPTMGSMGVSIGYHMGGFFADLGYLMSGTNEIASGVKYTQGTGIQADIGYNMMMSSSFYMGFQLSYLSQAYTTLDTNGATSDTDYKLTKMGPGINLGFMF